MEKALFSIKHDVCFSTETTLLVTPWHIEKGYRSRLHHNSKATHARLDRLDRTLRPVGKYYGWRSLGNEFSGFIYEPDG